MLDCIGARRRRCSGGSTSSSRWTMTNCADEKEPCPDLAFDGLLQEIRKANRRSPLRLRKTTSGSAMSCTDPHVFDPDDWHEFGTDRGDRPQVAGLLDMKLRASATTRIPRSSSRSDDFAPTHTGTRSRVGRSSAAFGLRADGPYRAARDLLLRAAPRAGQQGAGRSFGRGGTGRGRVAHRARRDRAGGRLPDRDTARWIDLAIQGPPGAGKTTTGGQMIRRPRSGRQPRWERRAAHKVVTRLPRKT